MAAPLWWGESSSPISGQWTSLQLSRWPLYEAPCPSVKSVCYPIPVVRSCYAVWSTLPWPPVHWQTANHGNGMVEEAQSSADATAQASSAVCQATQAGTSSHRWQLRNECTRLTAECTSHSLSSTVDWWRENEQRFPSVACVAITTMFRPKMAWCLYVLIFLLAYTTFICRMMLLEVLPQTYVWHLI